jgi:hypothetical protein
VGPEWCLREVYPHIGGGYLDEGGRDLCPSVLSAPVGGGGNTNTIQIQKGGRGRDLRPTGLQAVPAPTPGANNMFIGLDPDVAFSGEDSQLATLMHNRFTLGDADREWSRNMPKHRVWAWILARRSRTHDYNRNRHVGAAKLSRTESKKAPKVKRGSKGGIRVLSVILSCNCLRVLLVIFPRLPYWLRTCDAWYRELHDSVW